MPRRIDAALLSALREAGATGRQANELAAQLDIDHRDVSQNLRYEQKNGAGDRRKDNSKEGT